LEAIQRVAASVNETQRRQENFMVVQTLKEQVNDWSAADIDDLGPLLLHDTFMVYRGDPGRELTVYLFQKCLFVCREDKGKGAATSTTNGKDGNGKKAQKKSKKNDGGSPSTPSTSTSMSANLMDSANNSTPCKLCVRGKILISRVAQVSDTSQDGTCSLQIFWSERHLQPGQQFGLESFTLKCRHQEQLQLWESSLKGLIDQIRDSKNHSTPAPSEHSQPPTSHCLARLDSSSTSLPDDNNRHRFNIELPLSRQQSNDTAFGQPPTSLSRETGSSFTGSLPSPALRTSSNNHSPHFELTEDYSHMNTVPTTELITQHVLSEQQVEEQDDYLDDDYDTYSSSITTPGTPLSFSSLPQHQHTTEKPLPHIIMINNTNDSDSIQYRLRSQSSPNIHPPSQHTYDNTIPTMPSYSQQQQYHHHHLSSPHRYQDIARFDLRRSNGDQDPQRPLYSYDTNSDSNMQINFHQSQQNLALSLESAPSTIKVKVHHSGGIYVLQKVPLTIDYQELVKRIENKMKCDTTHNNSSLASKVLKYIDEEGDLITMGSNEDLRMGLEHCGIKNTANFYIF
jgi:cell division control protein 24